MCTGSAPSAPKVPAQLPQAPVAPPISQIASQFADKRRRAQAMGLGASTILTGTRGVTAPVTTGPKTLLGQ